MCRISVNIDDKKGQEFKKVLSELGISTSDAIRLYVDAVIKDRDIPKDVDPFYEPDNLKRIRRNADELEKGLGEPHELIMT